MTPQLGSGQYFYLLTRVIQLFSFPNPALMQTITGAYHTTAAITQKHTLRNGTVRRIGL